MIEGARVAAQICVFATLSAGVAMLADWPHYHQLPPGHAIVKLSFTHGSNRQAECRRRTAEELAKLPPNMRQPLGCPRTRSPVYVELDLDGSTIYRASLPPSGIAGDGTSRLYERFVVPSGVHTVEVRMRDTRRREGFDYAKSGSIILAADDNFVIDFRDEAGGFVFR
jgi:hypothetical protein